jgi:hypothetical protein
MTQAMVAVSPDLAPPLDRRSSSFRRALSDAAPAPQLLHASAICDDNSVVS